MTATSKTQLTSPRRARRRFWRRNERGQSMVEFALTAPILVVLMLGLVEIGMGINSYLTVLASARDAARLGSQGGADDAALLNLVDVESGRLPTDIPTSATVACGTVGVCIDHSDVDGVAAVKVGVCYDHPLVVGIPGILSGTLKMCSETTMRVKSDDSG